MVKGEIGVMDLSFWRGKSVLVTGHTGFKGSWLVLMLSKLGARVSGVSDSIPTSPSLFMEGEIARHLINDWRIDIASKEISKVFSEQYDATFHLAAQPMVKQSYADPLETFRINTLGTANILEQLLRAERPSPVTIVVTTDKVYRNYEWEWGYRENDILGGYDPYSASKAAAELIVDSYRSSFYKKFKLGLASVRAGNVIGPGDYGSFRLIPDILRCRRNGDDLKLRFPNATRPWQFVLDPLFGYLMLAERMAMEPLKFSSAWNFGPLENGITVFEIAEYFKGSAGGFEISLEPSTDHEAGNLKLDSSKARELLGWRPKVADEKCFRYILEYDKSEKKISYLNQILEEYIG